MQAATVNPVVFALLVLTSVLAACEQESRHDFVTHGPQFGQQVTARAVNALGEPVSLADFSGQLVWVDYAAEWCAACAPQSAAVRSLVKQFEGEVVFVTVMTSEPLGYGHPATQATAQRWAERAALNPAKVVAADFSSMTLPQHALFGPDGAELFRHTGSLSAAQIRSTLERLR